MYLQNYKNTRIACINSTINWRKEMLSALYIVLIYAKHNYYEKHQWIQGQKWWELTWWKYKMLHSI